MFNYLNKVIISALKTLDLISKGKKKITFFMFLYSCVRFFRSNFYYIITLVPFIITNILYFSKIYTVLKWLWLNSNILHLSNIIIGLGTLFSVFALTGNIQILLDKINSIDLSIKGMK